MSAADKAGTGTQRVHYRRRTFLVKHNFQLRFALIPLSFLALFLLAGGVYLYGALREIFQYYLYLSHCSLENPWTEVQPAILRTVLVGGGSFLAVLGAWAWWRFSRLHADLRKLEQWPGGAWEEGVRVELARIGDSEVRALAGKLLEASQRFDAWEEEVRRRKEDLEVALRAARDAPDAEVAAKLAAARLEWDRLKDVLREVRVDEGLS